MGSISKRFCILLLVAFCLPVFATTYWCDFLNGNDGNNGLTPATAKNDPNKVMALLAPGDLLNLTNGGWPQVLWTTNNGTLANPITIWGWPDAQHPWVLSNGLNIAHSYYIVTNVTGWSTNQAPASNGIFPQFFNAVTINAPVTNVSFWGCHLSGFLPGIQLGAHGGLQNGTNGAWNCQIKWCLINNMTNVQEQDYGLMSVSGVGNQVFTNEIAGNGVACEYDMTDFFGYSNIYRGNFIHDLHGLSGTNAVHMDFAQNFGWGGGTVTNSSFWNIFEGNILSNNQSFTFCILQAQGAPVYCMGSNTFRNNLIIGPCGNGFAQEPNDAFVNNTFVDASTSGPLIWFRNDQQGQGTNMIVSDNIFSRCYVGSAAPIAVDTGMFGTGFVDYNFLTDTNNNGNNFSATYGTHNKLTGLAGFTSASSPYNLTLAGGSQCIGVGTNTSPWVTQDITGAGRVVPFDLGAYASVTDPAITVQPQNQTVNVGQTATFSVTATGTAPITYYWYKSGGLIQSGASSSYTTASTTCDYNGNPVYVVVSNSVGMVTSTTASLTVNGCQGTVTNYTSQIGTANIGAARF